MAHARWTALVGWLAAAGLLAFSGWSDEAPISGQIVGPEGPLEGAEVRWQGAKHFVRCGRQGQFLIDRPALGQPALTAWQEGYRIGALKPLGGRVMLFPLPAQDNPFYTWQSPDPDPLQPMACANCHQQIHEEWTGSAHARSAVNPRVLGLMHGKDAKGHIHSEWNLQNEHPLGVGVCSRCHAPTYTAPDLDYDLEKVSGVASRGVHCDLCHKVTDVPTDKLGTRFGIDGLTLLRPLEGDQLFYGPLKDAVRTGESFGFSPVYQESRFCASCHEGTIFGVKVYTTYSEWLESPAGQRGVQCQHCHMIPTGTFTNLAPGKGGSERDPHTLASHGMPGGNRAMLEKSVRGEVRFDVSEKSLGVTVEVGAEKVGHRVPTGFIDRHLLLLVEAWDEAGKELFPAQGSRLPPRLGDPWAGKAGWVYGRWLSDETGKTPLPFWAPAETETDTRLYPERKEARSFRFDGSVARLRVRLFYRRLWPEVARARLWEDNEMLLWDRWYAGKDWGK